MTVVLDQEPIVLSDPLTVDITAYRGDSGRFSLTVSNPDDTPIDLTSATWRAEIRAKPPNDLVVITTFEIELVDEDSSSIMVILPAANSALLPKKSIYDIEMTVGDVVVTLIHGEITAAQDVSRP